ncbi:MAG: riboflavin synthase [Candidatus Omnitrophica bacterium]|nr:riboflavin synthase [Candidatus Omnitrophota bacterium]
MSLKKIYKKAQSTLLEIEANKVLAGTSVGESICVEGVCLTVKERRMGSLIFEVMPYTLKNTTLGSLRIGQRLNLERSLKIGERLSGHFVLGHIDCIGLIRKRTYRGGNLCFEISVPKEFIVYCIPKGSVAIDGVSLTIMDVKSNVFVVYITSFTYQNTTFFLKAPSSQVNIEFDILIKTGLRKGPGNENNFY